MYLEFYKLREMPFRLAPEPRFAYWSATHAAALACMRSAHNRRNGCAIVVGERGAGKTTLLECLAQQDEPGPALVRIAFPPRSLKELQEMIRSQIDPDASQAAIVVACDNAQLFSEQMLVSLLLKTVLPAGKATATGIVLAGEPALARTLRSPALAGVGQASGETFHLASLTAAEVAAYIGHRLGVAGVANQRIFSEDICLEIHRETKGNPRLVNALCDAAMVVACERELREVGLAEMRRGLEDIARLSSAQLDGAADTGTRRMPTIDAPVEVNRSIHARVRLLHQGMMILERELSFGRLRVGRGADNELRIDSPLVSRYHCRIITTERMCLLEDARSTNGLYVNDRRVRNHRLRDGDVIKLGEHQLQYVELRPAPSDAT